MTETRTCQSCKGSGKRITEAFFSEYNQKQYPRTERPCLSCGGVGSLPQPDIEAIKAAIKGRKGLRSARPKDGRAYYVWRIARFHGGADMTMPVMASVEVHGDPWRPELDALADEVAKQFYGTDLAAARRWGRALGSF